MFNINIISKLLKRIFNRTVVCVIGIAIQVTYFIMLFWTLGTAFTYSYYLFNILGIILAIYIVNSDVNPSYKIAWMIPILVVPIFGSMFFLFFGNSHSGDRLRRRSKRERCGILYWKYLKEKPQRALI